MVGRLGGENPSMFEIAWGTLSIRKRILKRDKKNDFSFFFSTAGKYSVQ